MLGQEGVEGLLVSSMLDPAPTQQLLFARNRGGLIRLDQVGTPARELCWFGVNAPLRYL